MPPRIIPFNFIGTGRVGNRLFRGEATLTEDNGVYVVSGSALKGTGRGLIILYWICRWIVFIGGFVLLAGIALRFGCYSTSPTPENFLKSPGKQIVDLVVTALCVAGGVIASMLLCRFVFREQTTERLPAADVSAVAKGATFTQSQGENQPPIKMRYVTIKMKNAKRGISISCRQEYVSPLSSLFDVPLKEE